MTSYLWVDGTLWYATSPIYGTSSIWKLLPDKRYELQMVSGDENTLYEILGVTKSPKRIVFRQQRIDDQLSTASSIATLNVEGEP